jgi:hypothetical protein
MKKLEICRFCLENDGDLEDIFYDSSNDLSDKIFSVTNTEVSYFMVFTDGVVGLVFFRVFQF